VEGGNQIITAAEALEKVIGQLDSAIEIAEKEVVPEQSAVAEETEIDVLPGFPEKVEGEILFLDADNISTDGIYPGMYFLEYFVIVWHRSCVQRKCPWAP
jgi:homoaconitate hydratase